MLVSEMISDIKSQDLVLPEFQREYVWSREQAKQLLVSLTRKYPVGGLLFWKTQEPPELKNVDELPEKLGTVQVILDGQQRLTTLYMLVTGDIPPYYEEEDITNDIRDLYFNVDDCDFQYFQPVRMRDNPRWIKVVDCLSRDSVNVFNIAQKITGDDGAAFQVAQVFSDNLSKLKDIKQVDLPIQLVPAEASMDDAIDVFDRVNSLGTKLTEAELALTHVTGKWPHARRTIKAKMDMLGSQSLDLDLNFMTRALVCAVTGHALYEQIHNTPQPELLDGWARLSRMLDYLTNILPSHAHIHSTRDMSSTNPLIPLIRFLSVNGGKFPSETQLRRSLHWLYSAQIHQRYTGQTDSRLEHDVTVVNREDSPWQSLIDQIVNQRGRVEVLSDDYEGRGAGHPLYRMSLVLAKARGAIDWFNGASLTSPIGNTYRIHSHHIFPQSKLYGNGFSANSHLDRQMVNAIANRAFLTGPTNLSISNRLPEDYLAEVEDRYPGALDSQSVPMDTQLWRLDRYRDFLQARRELLASRLNTFMNNLIAVNETAGARPLTDLIQMGEGVSLEFKSSFQWDVVQGKQNTALRDVVLKTLVGFLNTEGGTLLIGVEDSGQVYGLERDLSILQGSEDRFLQFLNTLVANRIGAEYTPYITTKLGEVDGKLVCVVDTSKASEPAFLSRSNESEFYIRNGNTTLRLDAEKTVEYIHQHGI